MRMFQSVSRHSSEQSTDDFEIIGKIALSFIPPDYNELLIIIKHNENTPKKALPLKLASN